MEYVEIENGIIKRLISAAEPPTGGAWRRVDISLFNGTPGMQEGFFDWNNGGQRFPDDELVKMGLLEDSRGEYWHKVSKEKLTVEFLGQKITDEYTSQRPPLDDRAEWNDGTWMVRKISVEKVEQSLMHLCDSKHEEAEQLVHGYKATPKQMERYREKYRRAMADDFSENTNIKIIKKHEESLATMSAFFDLIEGFRESVADLIVAGELDKAQKAIELGRKYGAETTKEDIERLLESLCG